METYDLYGCVCSAGIEEVRKVVENSLGIVLTLHESLYTGEYYRSGDFGSETFALQRNYNDFEEEFAEIGFEDFKIILYVDKTLRPHELERALISSGCFRLLRRSELSEKSQ